MFEDISTFDAENPIVGSLLREIDLCKKWTDSDFNKSLPSQPGKEFETQKRQERLCSIKRFNKNNNNNNNNDDGDGGGGGHLFSTGPTAPTKNNNPFIPEVPNIHELLNSLPEEQDVQQRLNQQVPEVDDLLQQTVNNFRGIPNPTPQPLPDEVPFFANNASNFHIPAQTSRFNPFRWTNPTSSGWVRNDLFGSQATIAIRGEKTKEKTKEQEAIDDALYELPDNPDLELGDGLLETLGANAEDLFQANNITKKEEEDLILEKIKDEYGFKTLRKLCMKDKCPKISISFMEVIATIF